MLPLHPRLAEQAAARLGVGRVTTLGDVEELVERFGRAFPIGTIAKADAIGNGQPPPGADPDECAVRWLAELDAGGRPHADATSWTCWPLAVVFAGVLAHLSGWDVSVAVGRNVGDLDGNPPNVTADFHSVVELRLGGRSLVVDPMFMIGPVDVGGAWRRGPWHGRVDGDADGGRGWLARWSTPTGNGHVYRRVGGPLDEGDVAAFLDVSVTHSGWLGGQRWRLAGVEARATVLDEPDTGPIARLHRWEGDAWHTDEVACALWSDATALAIAHLWDDHPDR